MGSVLSICCTNATPAPSSNQRADVTEHYFESAVNDRTCQWVNGVGKSTISS